MRILKTAVLSFFLIAAAPVLVGIAVNADAPPPGRVQETVIVKTSPDGTWPYANSAHKDTSSNWI